MGGSGDFYVSRGDLPSQDRLFHFLREVAIVGHPTFASCFGFQCPTSARERKAALARFAESPDTEGLLGLPEPRVRLSGRDRGQERKI